MTNDEAYLKGLQDADDMLEDAVEAIMEDAGFIRNEMGAWTLEGGKQTIDTKLAIAVKGLLEAFRDELNDLRGNVPVPEANQTQEHTTENQAAPN